MNRPYVEDMDQDALTAAATLVGRTGAHSLEVGFLHDDVPVEEADWYAHAQYQGARIMVEHHRGPVEAMEALARRLLSGAVCRWCAKPVALSDYRSSGKCRWTRNGDKWERGCDDTETKVPVPTWARGGGE